MEELLSENLQLKELAQKYNSQIHDLKQRSSQHESQIQSLLKFNEKLLNIIEKQLNGQKIKSSDIMSLQPISQKSELQSDVFQSQLTNNIYGSILAQKKSNHFTPQGKHQPTHQSMAPPGHFGRENMQGPMESIVREQQLSIVVDGDRQHRGDDGRSQISSLIAEFKKPLNCKENKKTLVELSEEIKSQIAIFNEISEHSRDYFESRLQKLAEIRGNFIQLNSKSEVEGLVESLDAEQAIKEILKCYIHEI